MLVSLNIIKFLPTSVTTSGKITKEVVRISRRAMHQLMFFILCLYKSENRFIHDGDIVEGDIKVLPGQSRGAVPNRLWKNAEFVYDIESSLGKKRITHYWVQVPNQVNIWRRYESESLHVVKSIWPVIAWWKTWSIGFGSQTKIKYCASWWRLSYQRNKITRLTSWALGLSR